MNEKINWQNKKILIDAYNSGELVQRIFDGFGHVGIDELNSIQEMCVQLHNVGKINLLSLVKISKLKGFTGSHFFTGQYFFCGVIPKLRASIEEMMQCVHTLVKKGGDDMMANQPNAAFREWCEADITRAKKVTDAAKKDDSLAIDFLTFALTAGNMFKEAKSFVEEGKGKKRSFGITALGRMKFSTPAQARDALSTLLNALDKKPSDQVYSNILAAALEIVSKTDQIVWDEALEIVKKVCEAPGPHTIHYCAHALWRFGGSLSEDIVVLLLKSLRSLDPTNKGTVREFDEGLRKLLDTPYTDLAIKCMEEILTHSGSILTLSEFQGFSRALVGGPEGRFHKLFVSWMLSGEKALCDGLSKVLNHPGFSDKPINLPLKEFDLSAAKQVFLCRKAIGYLFLRPVIAGSILVSVLRSCDDDIAEEVRNLLFAPLLQNYGGKLRDYLDTINANDPAHPHVEAALKEANRYLEGLKSTGNIKELHPSEHERQIERLRIQDYMREVYKEAEKKSVMMNLVRRSVILYGNKSITYVDGPEGKRRPVEMELTPHSISMECPRLESIDPNGLDYMLRVFRFERLKS